MEELINNVFESFDIKLMITITVFTYCLLKVLELFINGKLYN